MTKNIASEFYESRIQKLQIQSKTIQKKATILSWIRVILFLSFLSGIFLFANAKEFQLLIYSIVIFILVFGWIIKSHNKAKFSINQNTHLIEINQGELHRLDGKLSLLPSGIQYMKNTHEYAPDLDIFGSNSVFQLIVRSKLAGTIHVLKNWMLKAANKTEITERHEAIKELSVDSDWRQDLTAYGYHGSKTESNKPHAVLSLVKWLDNNLHRIDKPLWAAAEIIMPLLSVGILFGMAFFGLAFQWIYVPLLVNFVFLALIFKPLMELTKEFGGMSDYLKGYENLIQEIEQRTFKSKVLSSLSSSLKSGKGSVSGAIKSLRRTLLFLLSRTNLFYQPFNFVFLLDLIWLRMALRWKKKNLHEIEKWFDSVHQIDALSDIASYSFSNAEFSFPIISDTDHFLDTIALGHPLINSHQRILNDFKLHEKGTLGLITGSNMSGKSTFLRTLGVNMVLAQMGAPVCATKFEFSLTRIFTGMRTQDNLEENVSSFYAELHRIKQLLDSLSNEQPVFYMLDEILKGTNSVDRHKGAISLISQLTNQNCRGLISTHDIELASLSDNKPNIENFSFNSSIEADEIIFDYKIANEPCRSFNASKLMEKMGIIISEKN